MMLAHSTRWRASSGRRAPTTTRAATAAGVDPGAEADRHLISGAGRVVEILLQRVGVDAHGSTYKGSDGQSYQVAPSALSMPLTPSAAPGGLNLSTIPVAAQKYANDCIDASARIILSHSGVNMSEDELEGIIAPGGTIDSQAAGLNKLDPQGKFVAMQGSGGSVQAMFAAIKASIDKGIGSILNVAPGSSLAGHTFAPGHFIAATGYNPDGSINVSDTAGGRVYSVSQDDAFQATRGRGIVAGTGAGPLAGLSAPAPGGTGASIPANATPSQVQQGIIAAAKARGVPDNQIPGILAVAQAESNFGQTGFMWFSTKTADTGYTGGAGYANNYDSALTKFLDNYQAGGLAAQGGPQAKQQAIDALNNGDPGPFLHWLQYGVQGAVPGAGGMNYEYAGNLQRAYQQWSSQGAVPTYRGRGGPLSSNGIKLNFGPNLPGLPGQPDGPSTLPDIVDQAAQDKITNLLLPSDAPAPQSGPVGPLANLPAPALGTSSVTSTTDSGPRPWFTLPPGDARASSPFDNAAPPADGSGPVSMPAPNIPIPALTGNYEIDSRNLQLVQAQIAIEDKQTAINAQIQKIADMQNDPTTDPAKLDAAQQKLKSDQLSLGVDKEKLQADQEKPLKGKNSSMETDAQQFGAGLFKGVFDDLGFGNVLGGKSPLDWGITKLLGGLAGWGIGEANLFADNAMAGGQTGGGLPGGGGGVGNGIFAGLLQSVTGLRMPASGVPLAPSSVATSAVDPNTMTHGLANGAAPGPTVYDNRITVQGNTVANPDQFLPSIQEQQNARIGGANSSVSGNLPIAPGG